MFTRVYFDHKHNKIYGNEIIDGKRHPINESFPYYYYIRDPSNKSDIKDVYGNPVIEQSTDSKKNLVIFKENAHTCEANIRQEVSFLQRRYKTFDTKSADISKINIAIIDIEVQADEFPNPYEAKYPINLISIWLSKNNTVYTFGLYDYKGDSELVKNYKFIPDEARLIEEFIKFFRKCGIDILSGYNVNQFDIPYIINRSKQFNIETSLSPYNNISEREVFNDDDPDDEGYTIYGISGISILDYFELYKKYAYTNLESFSLNFVCLHELKEGKLEYEGSINDAWKLNWDKFVEYNIQDVLLVKKLEDKKRFIELVIKFAYEALVPFDNVMSSVNLITGMVLRFCHDKNMVIPDNKIQKENIPFPGAYVNSDIGFHPYCISYDVESLYPTLIRQFNIDITSLVYKPEDTTGLIKTPVSETYKCSTPSGEFEYSGIYYKKEKGILPKIIEKLFQERKYFKNKKKICESLEKKMDISQIVEKGNFKEDMVVELVREITEEGYSSDYYDSMQLLRKILLNCFHPNTDIITVDGIKKLKDVKVGDKVYSINPTTKDLEIKSVTHTYEYDFDGYLNRIKNTVVNIAVTDEHKMLRCNGKNNIEFIPAEKFVSNCKNIVPLHNKLNSTCDEYIYLSDFVDLDNYNGYIYYDENDLRHVKRNVKSIFGLELKQCYPRPHFAHIINGLTKDNIKKMYDLGYKVYLTAKRFRGTTGGGSVIQVKVNTNDFSKFIGYYLSEGCVYVTTPKNIGNTTRGISKKITICQYKKVNPLIYDDIVNVFESITSHNSLGTRVNKCEKIVYCCSDLLFEIIEKYFGIKYEKHIYSELTNYLNKEKIFEGMYAGDGTKNKNLYTISTKYKRFFDDAMKLFLELGFIPRYRIENCNNNTSSVYRISWSNTRLYVKKYAYENKKEYFNGKIYNLTVEDNHTVCVGENGKFMWTGQSIYGVMGNKFFCMYNVLNAVAVTVSGRSLLQYLINNINDYFKNYWHKVYKKYYPHLDVCKPITKDLVVINDTDSCFLCFEELIKNMEIEFPNSEAFRVWANKFDEVVLTPIFDKLLDMYAKKYDVEQLINFKREKTILTNVVTASKKYANIILENEGVIYNPPKLAFTGIEVKRGDTPSFCKRTLEELVRKLLTNVNKDEILEEIRDIKKEYETASIESISINKGISNYKKYFALTDISESPILYPSRCPIHARASIAYNVMINKLGLKLQPITNGSKLKYCYVKPNNELGTNVIGYVGKFPEEFKTRFIVDRSMMWASTFEGMVQRFFTAMDWGTIILDEKQVDLLFEL